MKKVAFLVLICGLCITARSQSFYKEGRETPTQEQRLTKAQDKKNKKGKKQLTMQKKVKVAKKQDRKARREKPPKSQRY